MYINKVIEMEVKLTPDLAYTFGIVGGDGTFSESEKRISVTDRCFEFHRTVLKPLLERLFKKEASIQEMKIGGIPVAFRTRITSLDAIIKLKELGMPTKDKSHTIETPKIMFESSQEVIKEYIEGWMDAESWVTVKRSKRGDKSYEYPKIAFQVVSKKIRDDLVKLLECFGIKASTWEYKQMYGFQIIGSDKVKSYIKQIGFKHPEKLLRVQEVCRFEA